MAARRGAGEGSVYRNSEGLWCVSIELGRGPDGTRRRKVVKARTKTAVMAKAEEARAKAPDLRAKVAAGEPLVDRRRSTADYLAWWLADVIDARVAAGDMKAASASRYHQVVRLYLEPAFGKVPLVQLGPEHVHRLLRAMEAQGLAPATVKQTRTVANVAFKHAERWGHIARNPVGLVAGPRQPSTRLDDALTAAEARRVLEQAAPTRLHALAVLLLRLGLRKGEALALRWPQVDLEERTLRIEATRTRVAGHGVVETATKTRGSARTVPLPDDVAALLREHRARQAEERLALGPRWPGSDHVFTTELGNPLDPRNVLDWWYRCTEQAGLGKRRMHAARHTAATLLLDQGVSLEVVSAILGHSGLAITADVYARPTLDAKRRALQLLELPAAQR